MLDDGAVDHELEGWGIGAWGGGLGDERLEDVRDDGVVPGVG